MAVSALPLSPQPGETAAPAVSSSVADRTVKAGHAQVPSKTATTLGQIVVTAEKQNASQHDTAASNQVWTDDRLQVQGLTDSRQLLAEAANVTSFGQSNAAPSIRGIDGTGAAQGVDAFFAGTRPRLNVTVDGRPLTYNELVFGDSGLWDVNQVELLRGPQSLLQGRNAIAGTLAMTTRDPSFTPEAGGLVSAGNYGRKESAFYLSAPLMHDEMAFRLTADIQRRDSFLNYASYPGSSNPGRFDNRTYRAKWLYQPKAVPGLRELITLQYARTMAPQLESVLRPFDGDQASVLQMPVFASRSNAAISDTRWALSDRLSVQNLLTATALHVDRYAPAGSGAAAIETHQYTLEPHLVLERGDSWFSGVTGLYLYQANQHELIDYPIDERFHDRVGTAAVYANGTMALGDGLELTLGARYEQETHRRSGGDGVLVAVDTRQVYHAFLPKIDLAWHANQAWVFGALLQRGYNAGGAGVTFSLPITTYSYGPEHVRDYELYFRADLADDRLQLSGNLFYGDYRGLQLPFVLDPNPLNYAYVIRNARRAYNTGAELGLRWLPVRGLEWHANIGLLRTRITDDPNSGIQGNQFAGAPASTFSLGGTWRSAHGWDLDLSVRRSHSYFSDVENQPFGRIPGYWMGRLKAGYHFSNTYLFGGVDNVFDNHRPLAIFTYSSIPTPFDSGVLPPPRSWYAGVQYDFF